jgi:two-component system, OmpR family, sensor histidine kinase KdpD
MPQEPSRPDPDKLLAQIQAEEQARQRGHLKIFLGYAAGVGKTYAMLEAAHQRKDEGLDVVVGYVETHKRAETEALLDGLELIPPRQISYRNISLTEMDIDAILKRRPRLVLVDELAHTNAPGSRHARRHADVEELLDAGIDVYTTLNIQHIESLNDVVAQITGMTVRETVPDSVIDAVTDIELIDLPPDELIQRLKDGKVYVPDQAQRAIEKFFRKGNLTALRELALRRTAERVDDQMRSYMRTSLIPGPWPASERLLVCISPGALGERLIRTARRLAEELKAEWFAVYVETPGQARLSQEQQDQVARSMRLAEELGARTLKLPGESVAHSVLDYARRHNITKIIAGKPVHPRWIEFIRGSEVDRLIRMSGKIDVYVISSEADPQTRQLVEGWRPHRPLRRYLLGLLLVAAASVLSALVAPFIHPTNLVVIYLLSVVLAAVYLGRGPAILASILGVAAFDFFFIPPSLTLAVDDTEYLLTFVGLLAVSLVISQLTAMLRGQSEAVQRREAETVELYELGRDLTVAADLDAVAQAAIGHVGQTFGRQVAVFLPEGRRSRLFANSSGLSLSENDLVVADWSFEHGQAAGRGTDTLPEAAMRYQPLKTRRGVVGVLGIKPVDPSRHLTREQLRTLEAFANQIGLAIERASLAEQARQAELLEVTDKLQNALLNSISHDLRTPLVSITGALSSLADEQIHLDDAARHSLIETASEEADRLNRLVGNLLDMTRLESGAMRIKKDASDIQDLVGSALENLGGRLGDRPVQIDLPQDLPLVPLDFVLIERVLVNVIDNALKYSPENTPIEISAHAAGAFLEINVADHGMGIPPEDLNRIFDKFYRVQRPDNVSGTGLGLSISKGIVQAQGGFIAAENRPGGGTIITINLPLA